MWQAFVFPERAVVIKLELWPGTVLEGDLLRGAGILLLKVL
jgi:hypothetical protein